MNIFSKIFTALKGGASEMGEAIVDANAIEIFEQELRDARISLGKAKESEISLVANQRRAEAKVKVIEEKIAEYENHARAALEKGDEELALETAQRVVELENDRAEQQKQVDGFELNCEKLRKQIAKAEAQITEMENNLSQVKATDSVHKAQQHIHSNITGGRNSVASAKDSLERIKARQEEFDAKMEVAEELELENDLDRKLENAGIKNSGSSAEDVLAKLKAEKS